MKQVQLAICHNNFFCPATGHLIMSDEDFDASPALLFCYLEEEGNFMFIQPWLIPDLEKAGLYYHGDIPYMNIEKFRSFLVKRDLPDVYLNFEITILAPARFLDSTIHICIDMEYNIEKD